jgi:hypothetical protein
VIDTSRSDPSSFSSTPELFSTDPASFSGDPALSASGLILVPLLDPEEACEALTSNDALAAATHFSAIERTGSPFSAVSSRT